MSIKDFHQLRTPCFILIFYIRLHENIPLPPYCKLIFSDFFVTFHDEIKYINTNEAKRLIINITLVIKKNDIKYYRYLAIRIKMVRSRPLLDRSRPKVGRSFLRFFSQFHLCPQTKSSAVIQKITEKHGKLKEFTEKTRKPLRKRGVSATNPYARLK